MRAKVGGVGVAAAHTEGESWGGLQSSQDEVRHSRVTKPALVQISQQLRTRIQATSAGTRLRGSIGPRLGEGWGPGHTNRRGDAGK